MTDDLIAWLLSRIDTAHEAVDRLPWPDPTSDPVVHAHRQRYAEYIERRAATEADKRSIVEQHLHVEVKGGIGCQTCAFNPETHEVEGAGWCATVRAIAVLHADDPGYQQKWRLAT